MASTVSVNSSLSPFSSISSVLNRIKSVEEMIPVPRTPFPSDYSIIYNGKTNAGRLKTSSKVYGNGFRNEGEKLELSEPTSKGEKEALPYHLKKGWVQKWVSALPEVGGQPEDVDRLYIIPRRSEHSKFGRRGDIPETVSNVHHWNRNNHPRANHCNGERKAEIQQVAEKRSHGDVMKVNTNVGSYSSEDSPPQKLSKVIFERKVGGVKELWELRDSEFHRYQKREPITYNGETHYKPESKNPLNWPLRKIQTNPASNGAQCDQNDKVYNEEVRKQERLNRFGSDVDKNAGGSAVGNVDLSLEDFARLRGLDQRRAASGSKFLKSRVAKESGWSGEGIADKNGIVNGEEVKDWKLRPIIIDGSNVALNFGEKKNFDCNGIRVCVDYFCKRGHDNITVVVPEQRMHCLNAEDCVDGKILQNLLNEGHLLTCWSRQIKREGKWISSYDDRMIVQIAHEKKGIVVSNDQFRDLYKQHPQWRSTIDNRVLQFRFMPGKSKIIMFPMDPLGRYGPTLEEFLRF